MAKKVLIDTSVFVAGLDENHIHFVQALPWILKSKEKKIEGYVSCHCLAEVFSNLCRVKDSVMATSRAAINIIEESILGNFKTISLSTKDYQAAMQRVNLRLIRGGVIYDALHVQSAIKKRIKTLVTFNMKDFERLVDPEELRVLNPLTEKY